MKNAVNAFSKIVHEGGTDAMKETELMKNYGKDYATTKNFNHKAIFANTINLNIPSDGELEFANRLALKKKQFK